LASIEEDQAYWQPMLSEPSELPLFKDDLAWSDLGLPRIRPAPNRSGVFRNVLLCRSA
jgi:hypothetical protein